MKEFLQSVNLFCETPIMQFLSSIILIAFGINLLFRVYKTLKQPAVNLYENDNLKSIAFGLDCVIEGYREHFTDDELLCSEEYVKFCVLHREVCKMIGEDTEGRKLKCSK